MRFYMYTSQMLAISALRKVKSQLQLPVSTMNLFPFVKLLTPVPSFSYNRQTKKDRLVSDLLTLKVQKKNKNNINHLKIKRSETDREILFWGCFLVLRKLLFVSFCVVVWVLFSVFSIFCITSLVSATPRNHRFWIVI